MSKQRRNHSAAESINIWMNFFNQERTHQSLDRQTPEEVYFNQPTELLNEQNRTPRGIESGISFQEFINAL